MNAELRGSHGETTNFRGTLAEVLQQAVQGDAIGFFRHFQSRESDDGSVTFDGEYYFAAVLFSSPAMKILSRVYQGEPEWVEPIDGTVVEPVVGTTILTDDGHITLINQDGQMIPCARFVKAILLRNRLPRLSEEFFWSLHR